MVVVPDPPLVPGNRTGGLDAPDETDLGEGVERVVDRLVGDRGQGFAHGADDGLGVRMRMFPHRLKHRDPLFGHTQGGLPQGNGRVLIVSVFRLVHITRMPASLESVKESPGWLAEEAAGELCKVLDPRRRTR